MFQLFAKGGPVMWPLLLASIVTMAVVLERVWFYLRESRLRRTQDVDVFLEDLEKNKVKECLARGRQSSDFVVRVLVYALENREKSLSNAFLQAANRELGRFSRGLPVLDTMITLAPLLGLLGTVTGLIHSFGLLGDAQIQAPTALTGGIAEALVNTAFGLVIAITALIPFNYLNSQLERTRHELEDTGTQMELILRQSGN